MLLPIKCHSKLIFVIDTRLSCNLLLPSIATCQWFKDKEDDILFIDSKNCKRIREVEEEAEDF